MCYSKIIIILTLLDILEFFNSPFICLLCETALLKKEGCFAFILLSINHNYLRATDILDSPEMVSGFLIFLFSPDAKHILHKNSPFWKDRTVFIFLFLKTYNNQKNNQIANKQQRNHNLCCFAFFCKQSRLSVASFVLFFRFI